MVTEDQFKWLLQIGSGRAVLYARDHDVSEFRELIPDACLHCLGIDPQCEGTRADFMLDVLDQVPDRATYYDAVLRALPGSGDDYHARQRFRIAADLAYVGDEKARQAMYSNFAPGPLNGVSIGLEFVGLDGLKGLLFAAEKLGELWMAKSNPLSLDWLLRHSVERLGEKRTLEALRKAGAQNAAIEAYRIAASAESVAHENLPAKMGKGFALGYDELKPELLGASRGSLMGWGKRASDVELERAARGLMGAADEREVLAHLRLFEMRRFPLDHRVLLASLETGAEAVKLAAVKALSFVEHPDVRDLALRLVDSRAAWRRDAIELLARNFQPGDHEIALGWFEREDDLDVRHSFSFDLSDLYEQHPEPSTEVRMLLAQYELGPCSFCRESIVRRLIELGALTEELRAECAYDCNSEVRQLVASGEELP